MNEFSFRPVEISARYPVNGDLTYRGYIVDNGDVESVMRWENTRIHNFADSRFDYISVAVESLLAVLGKEPRPDPPQKLIIPVSNGTQELALKLQQSNFPRIFEPIPSESEVELYSRAGCAVLGEFLNDAG